MDTAIERVNEYFLKGYDARKAGLSKKVADWYFIKAIKILKWLMREKHKHNKDRLYDDFLWLGDIHSMRRDYKQALQCQKQASSCKPHDHSAYIAQINSLLNLGWHAAALNIINTALKYGRTAEIYRLRGEVEMELSNYETAEKNFEKSLELDPSAAETYLLQGDLYDRMQNTPLALKNLDKALTLEPDNQAALFHRGLINLRSNLDLFQSLID
ncbi:MAG: tetratricopeptide repeat protein, partial [Parcubacteria group bacterium]|nr:tetratricopeptide repeat protein [Parcubacteria group bacterium]